MPEDMSEYPSWLKSVPVYTQENVAAEIQQKHPGAYGTPMSVPSGGDDAAIQAALAANAAVAQQSVAPFSEDGQQRLKKEEEMTNVVDDLLGTDLPPPTGPDDPSVDLQYREEYDPDPSREEYSSPAPEYHEDVLPEPSLIDEGEEIPEGHFLLRSGAGDIFLRPCGFQDEARFIVLYFEPGVLAFRPGLGTRFLGAVDALAAGSRTVYDLYFSGITFQLDGDGKNVLVFHKA